MEPIPRFIPLTSQQIMQRATISVVLLIIFLASLIFGIVRAEAILLNPVVLILGFASGLIGLPMTFSLFVRQIPRSRAFWASSKVVQAVVLRSRAEEQKQATGGFSGIGEGGAGCAAIILDLLFLAVPRSPTHRYYIDIQFNAAGDETGGTQKILRGWVTNDLYSRVKKGSAIKVQYSTADPHVILIGPEILDRPTTRNQ